MSEEGPVEYVYKELDSADLDDILYENLKWRPDFDPNEGFDPTQNLFVISADTGEGKEYDEMKDNDYNVLSIYQLEMKSLPQLRKLREDQYLIKNMFRLKQVGLYRDNYADEEIAAKIARALTFDVFGGECTTLVLEMNFNGKFFLNIFSQHEEYFEDVVMRTYHTKPVPGEKPPRKKAGFKIGNDKEHFCKEGRILIRDKGLIPNDEETISEFKSFGRDKRGKFKGIGTHDDTVMACLNVARLFAEPSFSGKLFDILEDLPESTNKNLINKYLERYEDSSAEMGDESFSSLFSNDNQITPPGVPDLNEMFRRGSTEKSKWKAPTRMITK